MICYPQSISHFAAAGWEFERDMGLAARSPPGGLWVSEWPRCRRVSNGISRRLAFVGR